MTSNLKSQIVLLYVPGVTSLRQVADALGTDHHQVRRALVEAGIQIKKAPHPPVSDETRRKLSDAKKGFQPPWLGKPPTRVQRYKNIRAKIRFDVTLDWVMQFEDIDRLIFLNQAITPRKERWRVSSEWYVSYVEKFWADEQFNTLYDRWLESGKEFYKRPTIDHIEPSCRGINNDLSNLQFLTWFENRAKNDMTQDEWNRIKSNIAEYLV